MRLIVYKVLQLKAQFRELQQSRDILLQTNTLSTEELYADDFYVNTNNHIFHSLEPQIM